MIKISKKIEKVTLTLMFFLVIFSCTNNKTISDEPVLEEFMTFKSNFPELYQNIGTEHIQKREIETSGNLSAKGSIDAVTFPIIKDEKVIGRYFGLSDESASYYIDFTDYENQITIYNANNPSQFQTIEMILDTKTNTYVPKTDSTAKNQNACAIACGLGGLAIALSDGPFPVMDFLAMAYTGTCLAGC